MTTTFKPGDVVRIVKSDSEIPVDTIVEVVPMPKVAKNQYIWIEYKGKNYPFDKNEIDLVSSGYTDKERRVRAVAPDLLDALVAIRALMDGEWDNPALVKYGPLHVNHDKNVRAILDSAITLATPGKD